jgi:hypothetical protein
MPTMANLVSRIAKKLAFFAKMEHHVRFHQSPESQNTATPPKHQAISKP